MEALGLIVEPRVIKFQNDGKTCQQKLRVINGGPSIREMFFNRGPMLKNFKLETNHTKPAKFAAGFEIAATISYVCCSNETVVDNVVVSVDGAPYEVRIVAEPKRSRLELMIDMLDFGKVVAQDSMLCRGFIISNEGLKEGAFHVLHPFSNVIHRIDPLSGVLPENSCATIVVYLQPNLIGEFKITISITMDDVVRKLLITGHVLDQLVELRDLEGGEVVSRVKFSPTYYGVDSTFDASLVNLTPETLNFAMALLENDTIEDDKISAVNSNNLSGLETLKINSCGRERRMESLMDVMARFKESAECYGFISPIPTMLTVSPSEGVLKPNEDRRIRFRFSPRWVAGNKGFKCLKMCPPTKQHTFTIKCLTSLSFTIPDTMSRIPIRSTCIKDLQLPVEGISVPHEMSLMPEDFLDLGFCLVGGSCHSWLSLCNRSPWLPFKFRIRTLAHFHISPDQGEVDPRQETKIQVTFRPRQSGNFEPYLMIDFIGDVCSEEDIFTNIPKVFQTMKLKLIASSKYIPGSKAKYQVNNSSLNHWNANGNKPCAETKSNKEVKIARPSIKSFQMFRKSLEAVSNPNRNEFEVIIYTKDQGRGGNKFSTSVSDGTNSIINVSNNNDICQSDMTMTSEKLPAIMDASNNQRRSERSRDRTKSCSTSKRRHPFDPEYNYTDEELQAKKQHEAYYNKLINVNARRFGGKHLPKRFDAASASTRVKTAEGCQGKNKNLNRNNNSNNNEANKVNSSNHLQRVAPIQNCPMAEQEKMECSLKLPQSKMNFITTDPNILNFGMCCAGCPIEGKISVSNHLDQFVFFEFDGCFPELAGSNPVRQVIPPRSVIELNIVLCTDQMGNYYRILPYRINGEHKSVVTLVANVCQAILHLQPSVLVLKQKHSLTTDRYVRSHVTIKNPLNSRVSFEWNHSNLVLDTILEDRIITVFPAKGVISPYGTLECEVCCDPLPLNLFCFDLNLIIEGGTVLTIFCQVELGKPRVCLLTPKILLKDMALGEATVLHAFLKNNGAHPGYYKIQDTTPIAELEIKPSAGVVNPGEVKMLDIIYMPKKLVWFDISLFISLKFGKDLELRIICTIETSDVYIDVAHFDFGQVYCNTISAIPFTLTNKGNSKALVRFSFKGQYNFKIRSDNHDRNSSGNDPKENAKELVISDMAEQACTQLITVPSKGQVPCLLECCPSEISMCNFFLTLTMEHLLAGKLVRGKSVLSHKLKVSLPRRSITASDSGTSKSSLLQSFVTEPLKIPVDAVVVRQPLLLSHKAINFEVKAESLEKALCSAEYMTLILTNNNKEDGFVICLNFNQPNFHAGIFRMELTSRCSKDPPEGDSGDFGASSQTGLGCSSPVTNFGSALGDGHDASKISPDQNRKEGSPPFGIACENFKVSGWLRPGEEVLINVFFCPECRDGRKFFQSDMVLCLNSEEYAVIPIMGKVRVPRLTFVPPMVVFQPTPLNTKNVLNLNIFTREYLDCTMLYVLKFYTNSNSGEIISPISAVFHNSDECSDPSKIHISSEDTQPLKMMISLSFDEPISFSGWLNFKDGFGNKFKLEVSGSCDNSILSTYFFIMQRRLNGKIIMKSEVPKDASLETSMEMEDSSDASKQVPQFILSCILAPQTSTTLPSNNQDDSNSFFYSHCPNNLTWSRSCCGDQDNLKRDHRPIRKATSASGFNSIINSLNKGHNSINSTTNNVTNHNNAEYKDTKSYKKTIIRHYEVIGEGSLKNKSAQLDDESSENILNSCNVNCNSNKTNSENENFARSRLINSKLNFSAAVQFYYLGNCFVPDDDMSERGSFEQILDSLEKWIGLHGWKDSTNSVKIPHLFRKWNYSSEIKEVSPDHSLAHVEKNFFRELFVHLTHSWETSVKFVKVLPEGNLKRAFSMHQQHSEVLNFLKINGGCVAHVKPEYLLNWEEFLAWHEHCQSKLNKNKSDENDYDENEPFCEDSRKSILFEVLSLRSWMDVFLQLIKLMIFEDITLKKYKSQPMPKVPILQPGKISSYEDSSVEDWPGVNADRMSSNLYSPGERILLTWMNHIYNKFISSLWSHFITDHIPKQRHLMNFDSDLSDGIVLITILYAYIPYLIEHNFSHIYLEPKTPEERCHNAVCITKATRVICMDYHLEAQDITHPNPISLLLLASHLFTHLPSYLPREKISVFFQLHQPLFKEIEIKNPSSETVVYETVLLGADAGKFGVKVGTYVGIKVKKPTEYMSSIFQALSEDVVSPDVSKTMNEGLRELFKGDQPSLSMASQIEAIGKYPKMREQLPGTNIYHPDLSLPSPNLNYNANQPAQQKASRVLKKNITTLLSLKDSENNLKMFAIPPMSKINLHLYFQSNKMDSCHCCLFFVSRKVSTQQFKGTPNCSFGSNLVFTLEALLHSLSLEQKRLITVECACYNSQEVTIPVSNNYKSDLNLDVILYSGSNYFGHEGEEFKLHERSLSPSFFSTMKTLFVRSTEEANLSLIFIPLVERVHWCTLVLRDPQHGDLCFLICGVAKAPPIEEFENSPGICGRVRMGSTTSEVHWKCKVGQEIEKVVFVPVISKARDEAITAVRHHLNMEKANYLQKGIEFNLEKTTQDFNFLATGNNKAEPSDSFSDLMYKISTMSINFHTMKKIVLPSSKVATERLLNCQRIVPMVTPMTIKFQASSPGIYTDRIILENIKNAYDTRIFQVSCIVSPEQDVVTIEMTCAVGKSVHQELPITNETSKGWNFDVNVKGNLCFSGPSSFCVPAKATQVYLIRFSPFFEKTTEAEVLFTDAGNDVEIKYNLVGHGTMSAPAGKILLEGFVGHSIKHTFEVYNPALQRLEFFVQSNLDIFCGFESFIVMPKSCHLYESNIIPNRRGRHSGVLTFIASDRKLKDLESDDEEDDNLLANIITNFCKGQKENLGTCRVWYEVELEIKAGLPLSTVEVECFCLCSTEIEISVSNPLAQELNFEVYFSSSDLEGESTFTVGPEQTGTYRALFASAFLRNMEESVCFFHQKTGEFWYKLVMNSKTIPVTTLPCASCELGSNHIGQVILRNPSIHHLSLFPFSSNPQCFSWNVDLLRCIELPPKCSLLIDYTFTARCLHLHSAKIGFTSEQIGMWEFEVTGEGIIPGVQTPIEMSCSPNSHTWHVLPFINSTNFLIMVNTCITSTEMEEQVETKDAMFEILNKNKKIKMCPGEKVEIVISFAPNCLRLYTEWSCLVEGIKVDGSHWDDECLHLSLKWIFPLVGKTQLLCPEPRSVFEVSKSEIVSCFKTSVNMELNRDLVITLESDPCWDYCVEGDFKHELLGIASAMEDFGRSVCIKKLEVCKMGNTFRLKFNVHFSPIRAMRHVGDLVVTNERGGSWRYRLMFEAEETVPYRELHIWANGLSRESRINFILQHPECTTEMFTTKFSKYSGSEFTFCPREGYLTPEGVIFTVVFKPEIYGKIFKANIIVKTNRYMWMYLVIGHSPVYEPPLNPPPPAVCKLPPLKKPHRINFVRENLKICCTASSSPCKRC